MGGPEGFGIFRNRRRLVTMFRKDAQKNEHVVIIYENDEGVFNSNGVFKEVRDLLFSSTLGYGRGSVLIIEKK